MIYDLYEDMCIYIYIYIYIYRERERYRDIEMLYDLWEDIIHIFHRE